MNLCGSSRVIVCAQLADYRFDDAKKPVTLLGLLLGWGGMGSANQNRNAGSAEPAH